MRAVANGVAASGHVCASARFANTVLGERLVYLLGLLAQIKCSICSYQYDNWYAAKW